MLLDPREEALRGEASPHLPLEGAVREIVVREHEFGVAGHLALQDGFFGGAQEDGEMLLHRSEPVGRPVVGPIDVVDQIPRDIDRQRGALVKHRQDQAVGRLPQALGVSCGTSRRGPRRPRLRQ